MDNYNGVPLGVEGAWALSGVRTKQGRMRPRMFEALSIALAIAGSVLLAACTKPQAKSFAPPSPKVTGSGTRAS